MSASFFLIPLTSGVSIAKVFFTCQYIFLKSLNSSRFQDIGQALGPPNGRLDRKRDSGLLEPQSGMHCRALKKELDTQNSILYSRFHDSEKL